MQPKPYFSIIITCKNALQWLEKCITSIQKQTYKQYEILFVDDGSTDTSLDFVKKNYPDIVIVENLANVGFARANNAGATVSKGTHLLILNADTYMDTGTLEIAAAYIAKHPSHSYMQLDIRKYDKSNMDGEACIFGMDRFGYPIWKGSGEPFYADAAAMIIQRDLFFKLGGFDESYFIYLEDLDLAWRARLLGKQIHYIPQSYVYHFAGGTSVSTQNKKGSYVTTVRRRYDAQKNNLRSILKNFELSNVVWILPTSCAMASVEGFLYLLKGNISGFIALHKSILWNITHLTDTLAERKKMQSTRTISDKQLFEKIDKRISKLHSLLLFGVPSMKK